jgi:Cytochrome b
MPRSDGEATRVAVWDLPTRLFHWVLVVLVTVGLVTGNVGGVQGMEVHMLAGYAILALVGFRLVWGFVGSRHARFADFVAGPRRVLAYAREMLTVAHRPTLGHNPLGGWSVLALLASLLVQASTGLFANDDILTEGPLASKVSKGVSDALTAVHEINANLLYVLIGVHLCAIVFYAIVHRENLVRPMVTGWKSWVGPLPDGDGGGRFVSPALAAAVLAVAAGAVWWILAG